MCDVTNWRNVSKFRYCLIHKKTFEAFSQCPMKDTPTLHMENNSSNVSPSKDFTNNSRTITNKSRRVYVKSEIYERFHSYRIKYEAVVHWEALFQYEEKSLNNNVKFKIINFDEAIVRVFRKSILITIRSSKEVTHTDVKTAKLRSDEMVLSVVSKLPKAIKIKDIGNLSSVHNAFVNHPTGDLFKKEFGRELCVRDDDNSIIELGDHSHGKSETELVHSKFTVPMSEYRESYEKDLLKNRVDFPSIQDRKIREVIDVLHEFATEFKVHSSVQHKQETNMDKMAIMLDKINDSIVLSSNNVKVKQESNLKTISKYDQLKKDKIKQFIEEYK